MELAKRLELAGMALKARNFEGWGNKAEADSKAASPTGSREMGAENFGDIPPKTRLCLSLAFERFLFSATKIYVLVIGILFGIGKVDRLFFTSNTQSFCPPPYYLDFSELGFPWLSSVSAGRGRCGG